MLSTQPIQYETDTGVSYAGGESNTSDETSYVRLRHSHEHCLCDTFNLLSVLTMARILAYS